MKQCSNTQQNKDNSGQTNNPKTKPYTSASAPTKDAKQTHTYHTTATNATPLATTYVL